MCTLKKKPWVPECSPVPGNVFFACHFLCWASVEITLCCSEMVAMGTSQPSHYLLRLLIILSQETELGKGCEGSQEPPPLPSPKTVIPRPLSPLCWHLWTEIFSTLISPVFPSTELVNELHPQDAGAGAATLSPSSPPTGLALTFHGIKATASVFSCSLLPSMFRCKGNSFFKGPRFPRPTQWG